MADQTIPQTPDDDEALKKRLVGRMALAAVLIVALLGGLALFDALNAPEKPAAPAPVAAVPPAPEPKPAEAAKPEEKTEAKAEDEAKEAPAAEPERTESAGAPALRGHRERPLTRPAEARPAMMKPSEPPAPPAVAEETARIAKPPASTHAPASRPLTRAAEVGRRFLVQLGVFNNVANAEELRAKLELNGIPSQIEARVQVGPFGSRQEAEEARQKLSGLGLEPGVVMAVKR
ncbi:MAG: SPOR domain-containing protein [Rhodocyclaceae bacterium]|nr:SPOR domain-containing protein [Rhodocyclaceae bacterium]